LGRLKLDGPLVSDWIAYLDRRFDIAKILDPRCFTIEWLDGEIMAGRIKIRINNGAMIGFEVKTYPAGARELHGMFAVGNVEDCLALWDEVEAQAAASGFEFATIASREGWARVMRSRGYVVHQTEIRKELG